jgi:hypothetical protein
MPAQTGCNTPVTENPDKKFESWYNRVSNGIGELRYQLNTIATKTENLYNEPEVSDGREKQIVDMSEEPPPRHFYDCLIKIEKDLTSIVKKAGQIGTSLNQII